MGGGGVRLDKLDGWHESLKKLGNPLLHEFLT